MRLDPVLEAHLPSTHSSILDLGCGRGELLNELYNRGYKLLAGVDKHIHNPHAIACGVVEKDARDYLWNNDIPYACVIMWDVIEHFKKSEIGPLLSLTRRNLLIGGTLILHLPNAEGLFGSRIYHSDLTHRWAYTPQLITSLLEKAGFVDIQCHECRPIVHGPVSFLRYVAWLGISWIGRMVLAVETGQYNGVVSQNFIVTAKKGGATCSTSFSARYLV